MIKLAISGCAGRMGSAIWGLALQDPDFEVKVVLEKPGHPLVGQEKNGLVVTDAPTEVQIADVLVEFTTPEATTVHVGYAVAVKKAMVIGTTGLSEERVELVKSASKTIPILFSPNMSIGVNLLFSLVPEVAKKLGPGWDIEIVEAHRKAKKDAPSGTAKKFAQLISEAIKKEVPAHALRMGDVAGDHTIIFAGQGERIEIVHRAQSPVLFAQGALSLTKKLVNQPPGLYSPADLL
jgi:4-hydroxy-tetrahydrodipicolinate reductase